MSKHDKTWEERFDDALWGCASALAILTHPLVILLIVGIVILIIDAVIL